MRPDRRSFWLWTTATGILALLWLALRSGSKPSRFTYPCQQAAFSTASLAFGVPLAAALLVARRRIARGGWKLAAFVLATAGLAATLGLWGYLENARATYTGPVLSAPADYRAQVFHQTGCARDPVGDHFPGLDDLIEMMGGHGLKFYQSDTPSLVAGPDGVIGPDDVVVIKINYQWSERGGTNTDLLRGLIRRIFDHPDSFQGEVVVCENAQFASTEGFDRAENNAQDIAQSPHDVVAHFQSQGHRVSHYDWTPIRFTEVDEYSAGDMDDGYIRFPFDAQYFGRKSYPKFQTAYGTRISLKHGIWTDGSVYDRERLKFLNLPVLKSHHATYGVTACVKNYMGVVTRELDTNSHLAIRFGILGAVIGEIRPADLNILDCIWINANPNLGPGTGYDDATRKDMLVASLDPVAADIWADKNILIPAFLDNGHSPPWPSPSAEPDDPTSDFRRYLDASMYQILAAGHQATNDLAQIDALVTAPPGEASDVDRGGAPFRISKHEGGYELTWSDPVRGGYADEFILYRTDLLSGSGHAQPECEAYLGTGNSTILPSLTDNHGFIVVGRNPVGDGSFGHDSLGNERPSPAVGSDCP
jgi:uncharacterized protein (DUF362 family)